MNVMVNILTPISYEPVTKYRHAHLPILSWMAHTVEELSTSVTPRLSQLHSWNRLNRQLVEHTLTQVAITTAATTETTTITITTTIIIITNIIVTKLGLYEE
jgi:hypothetical protein